MSREAAPLSDEHPAGFTLLTINLLSGAARWEVRRELILAQTRALAPDVIAVQEVAPAAAGPNAAAWLASGLGYEHVRLCWQPPGGLGTEAVGLISRLALEQPECLRLDGQQRVALRALIRLNGRPIFVACTHLYWQPGDSSTRLRQVEQLSGWLQALPGRPPGVIAGDFNGGPQTRAIRRMAQEYPSAFAAANGREPGYTFPTPLRKPRREALWGALRLLRHVRLADIHPGGLKRSALRLHNTLDYIFVDPRLHVAGCRLALDRPAEDDPGVYPSDHFGLLAKIESKYLTALEK